MESGIQTEKIILKREKLSVAAEQIVESDLSLPDYCGDIVKILSCCATSNIFSAGTAGDKAIVDGCTEVRILYINGDGKTEIFDSSLPFNRNVDIKDLSDNDIVTATVTSEQITCRAVNQRRADIRGSISIKITIMGTHEEEFITGTDIPYSHILKKEADGYFLSCFCSKPLTLNESADVQEGVKAVKIYRASVIPTVHEVRAVKNKFMIKGNVSADIVFLTENGAFATQRINMPVNQITDMEGVDETDICCTAMTPSSIIAKLIPDTPQSPSRFEVSVIMNTVTDAYKKKTIAPISEAYSSKCELLCRQQKLKYITSAIKVNDNYTASSKLDFSSCKAVGIKDISVRNIKYTVKPEDGNIILKGNILYGIVLTTAENENLYLERVSDFVFSKVTGEEIDYCDFCPVISVNGINFSLSDNYSASINTELKIDGFIYACKDMDIITSINEGTVRQKESDNGVITVYFASKGEKLWDIAKDHGSSTELIKESNNITDDALSEDRMLIFPLE